MKGLHQITPAISDNVLMAAFGLWFYGYTYLEFRDNEGQIQYRTHGRNTANWSTIHDMNIWIERGQAATERSREIELPRVMQRFVIK